MFGPGPSSRLEWANLHRYPRRVFAIFARSGSEGPARSPAAEVRSLATRGRRLGVRSGSRAQRAESGDILVANQHKLARRELIRSGAKASPVRSEGKFEIPHRARLTRPGAATARGRRLQRGGTSPV